jgi:hypothetical protein
MLQESHGPEGIRRSIVFKHFKEGRKRWQMMLEEGDQTEPSELLISRTLINCHCRQKINIIGNV